MNNVDIEILSDGNLLITADEETREELKETLAFSGYWYTLSAMMESYWANGGFEPFDAGDANPFVGLTDAPCIAESLDTDDDGNRSIVGRCWWFPNYMIRHDITELIESGRVVYDLAGEWK